MNPTAVRRREHVLAISVWALSHRAANVQTHLHDHDRRLRMATDLTGVNGPTRARIDAKTLRTDRWWLYPAATFVVFAAFIVYATWRAFSGDNYFSEPYLSPF